MLNEVATVLLVIDVQAARPLNRHAEQHDGSHRAVDRVQHGVLAFTEPCGHGLKPDLHVVKLCWKLALQVLYGSARVTLEPRDPAPRVWERGPRERGADRPATVSFRRAGPADARKVHASSLGALSPGILWSGL